MKKLLLIIFLLSSFYAFPQGGSIPRSELVTASGTNTYAATISSIASLANGLTIKIKFTNANTGASTFTLTGSAGSMGSAALTKNDDTALSAGDISAGGWYWLVYNNAVGHWQISGGGSSAAAWGGITGTLSDQTDLQDALNLKISGSTTNTRVMVGFTGNTVTDDPLFTYDGLLLSVPSITTDDITINNGLPQSSVTDLVSDLALKAPLASPALTGNPTAPTQTAGDNSTKIATTAYVDGLSLTIGAGLTNTAGTLTNNLITGLSGGQSVIGGTASGNGLSLLSTSHATKGSVIIGSQFVFSESGGTYAFATTGLNTLSNSWTGTASGQSGISETGTITGRTSGGGGNADEYIFRSLNPTFVTGSGTNAQVQKGLAITGTFSANTAFAHALHINAVMNGNASNSYLIKAEANGTNRFSVTYSGNVNISGVTSTIQGSTSVFLSTPTAAVASAGGTTDFSITNQAAGGLAYRFRSANTNGTLTLNNGTTDILTINSTNRFLLAAGSSTIAQMRWTAGTILGTAAAGVMEYDGTNLHFTRTGTTRGTLIQSDAVNSVSPTAPDRTITVNIDGTLYYIHAKTTND